MRLRLVHDAEKAADLKKERAKIFAGAPGEAIVTDSEFALGAMTLNHGPSCAAFLVNKFRRKRDRVSKIDQGRGILRLKRYFVLAIATDQVEPLWFTLAIRHFESKPTHWTVEVSASKGMRYVTVRYLRPRATRKPLARAHLRIV